MNCDLNHIKKLSFNDVLKRHQDYNRITKHLKKCNELVEGGGLDWIVSDALETAYIIRDTIYKHLDGMQPETPEQAMAKLVAAEMHMAATDKYLREIDNLKKDAA